MEKGRFSRTARGGGLLPKAMAWEPVVGSTEKNGSRQTRHLGRKLEEEVTFVSSDGNLK